VLTEEVDGPVTLGGLVTRLRPTKIKSGINAGRMMARFVLEDLHGRIPVTLFANQFDQLGHLLEDEAVVILKGEVRERGSEKEMAVEEMSSLERAVGLPTLQVTIAPSASERQIRQLKDLILDHPGKSRVRLIVPGAESKTGEIERILGAGCVE
jgi:DNA polymerase III alpha subunit